MYDLHNQLIHWATIAPEQICIVEAETGRSMTYSHCLSAVQKMRQFLGAQPRNLILTLSGGIADAVLWLSALTGGHMLVPLAPDAAEEERARAVGMYKPDVLFVEQAEEAKGFSGDFAAQVVTRRDCEALIEQARDCVPLADKSAVGAINRPLHLESAVGAGIAAGTQSVGSCADRNKVTYPLEPVGGHVCLMTSGTTGEPKGVILDEYQIAWTADHIRTSHRLSPTDRGLTVLPFSHVNGPVVSLCASIMAGGTVGIARKFSRSHFWSWIEGYQVTWASIVPSIVTILLGTSLPAPQAGLPTADLRAFEAKFGIPLIETYGLQEWFSNPFHHPQEVERKRSGDAQHV